MSRRDLSVSTRLIATASFAFLVAVNLATNVAADETPPALKFTAVELTKKLREDKTQKLAREYQRKTAEIEGEVVLSTRLGTTEGWTIRLRGCDTDKGKPAQVAVTFSPSNPDLAKAKKLVAGDKIVVRGELAGTLSATPIVNNARFVAPTAATPEKTETDVAALKFTAVDLTAKFKGEGGDAKAVEFFRKPVEVEGEIIFSQKFAVGDGWQIRLAGCEIDKDRSGWVAALFDAANPDLPKAKKLEQGDKVTIRGQFASSLNAHVDISDARIVKSVPLDIAAAGKPDVTTTAEAFVKEAVGDPKATLAKYNGKLIELTGQVSTADPTYSIWGMSLAAGKIKPTDPFNVFVDCAVPEAQLEKTWLLAKNQKVKVVGLLMAVQSDRVRLAKCVVTELEPNPMPTVQASDIAADFAKNPKEAAKKYGDSYATKDMFLENAVVKSTKPYQYGVTITFDVPGKIPMVLQVPQAEAEGVKAGDKLRVKATCRGLFPQDKTIYFQGRILKTPPEKK